MNRLFRSLIVATWAVSLAMSPQSAKGQDDAEAAKEGKRLAGLWRIDVFEWDGQRSSAKEFKDTSSGIFESRWLFTTTKAEWVVNPDFRFEYARYKLDLRANPRTIDVQAYNETFKGIYQLDEKVLKACFSVRNPEGKKLGPGKENRPTDFTTKERSERLLLFFVRDKPEKK